MVVGLATASLPIRFSTGVTRRVLKCSITAPICAGRRMASAGSGFFGPAATVLRAAMASAGPCLPTARPVVSASAAAAKGAPGAAPAAELSPGIAVVPAAISIGLGLAVRFLVPIPAGVTAQAWSLLSVFLCTIVGLVLGPLPVGAWAFAMLTFTVVAKVSTFQAAFAAFTSDVIWLIVISFFFARGFVKTGLGDRVATLFVRALGKSTLGLAYGLAFSEALISPAMPSTTARAGGIFVPIIKSLAAAAGSLPGPTARRLGAFLVQSQLQCCSHSSAMFLTGAAQNLLCLKLAAELGYAVPNAWVTWFAAASLPALAMLLIIPALVYKLAPPEITDTPGAPAAAAAKLESLGPLTPPERIMLGAMGVAVALWVGGEALGVAPVSAAMLALVALLSTGVLTWDDCLAEKSAWDTLAWFAILVGMAGQLNAAGLVGALAAAVSVALGGAGLPWPAALGLLNAVFFGLHYLFASQTAQVGALYGAFVALAVAVQAPPVLSVLTLAYTANLFGAISHYSSGQAAIYYATGYNDLPTTFQLGLIVAVLGMAVYAAVGAVWWKVLGLY